MSLHFTQSDVERFFKYVEKLPNGCWYWAGARSRGKGNRKWYGSFRLGNRTVRAHRFAAEIAGKECPPGHDRSHTCHFSMCVNPDHIEIEPKEVNQRRRIERARILKEEGNVTFLRAPAGAGVREQVDTERRPRPALHRA